MTPPNMTHPAIGVGRILHRPTASNLKLQGVQSRASRFSSYIATYFCYSRFNGRFQRQNGICQDGRLAVAAQTAAPLRVVRTKAPPPLNSGIGGWANGEYQHRTQAGLP